MRRFDKKNNIRKANLLAEQRYLQSKGLISENMGATQSLENKTQGNTGAIENKIVAAIPKLIQNPIIRDISNKVMSDPKAIAALKQFMNKGGVNELENTNVEVPDMSFFKDVINYGVEHASTLKEDDQGGNIGAFFGMFVGGAYLADKFFPNPIVMQKIATNIGVVDQLGNQYDPMAVAGLGGLAAAILGCIAYNVFKKIKGSISENGFAGDGFVDTPTRDYLEVGGDKYEKEQAILNNLNSETNNENYSREGDDFNSDLEMSYYNIIKKIESKIEELRRDFNQNEDKIYKLETLIEETKRLSNYLSEIR